MSRREAWTAVAACVLLALAAGALVRTFAAPAPQEFFLHDQQVYLSMARQPFVQTGMLYPPASWRILPPLAARAIGALLHADPERGFLVLTFSAFALIPVATFAFLAALGLPLDTAVAGTALVALSPNTLGYTAWDVVRVDPSALALMCLCAYAVASGKPALLVVSIAALSVTKETALVGASFAVAWALGVDRRLLRAAVLSFALAVVVRAVVLPALIPPPAPFDNFYSFREMIHEELTVVYAARRLLLASGTSWNVLLPFAAVWLVDEWRNPRAHALLVAIVVAEAQILFASDTQRLTAAAYPFVIACCASQLQRFAPRQRAVAGAALLVAQLPWLLENGRVVHLAWLRGVEIAIVIVSASLAVWRLSLATRPRTASA